MKQNNYKKRLLTFQKRLGSEPDLKFIKKLFASFPKIEIYAVGGAVRDAMLGNFDQKDYDFVARNIEPKKLEKFLSRLGSINLVGKTFGVYKFLPKKAKLFETIDIAFPRTEFAFGTGGYRDVKTQSDPKMRIEDDLSRRDFTINAIALNLKNREIIDPYYGQKALKTGKIQAVGDPKKRFKEDYSRILRGLRFACQFDFKIEKNAWKAMRAMMPRINDQRNINGKKERILPYEVAAKEFVKAFYYNPLKAFELYDQSGAFKILTPEIYEMKNCPQPPQFHPEGDVWTHTKLALKNFDSLRFKKQFGPNAKNAELVAATLFHDIAKPRTIKTPERDKTDRIRFNEHDVIGAEIASKICKRLKLDSLPENSPLRVDPKRITQLIHYHLLALEGNIDAMRPATIEKYFLNPNFPGENLLKLTFLDATATIPKKVKSNLVGFYKIIKRIKGLRVQFEAKVKLPAPILDGHEIMAYLKLKPGPKIGELLSELRNAQLARKIKTKKQAQEFLKNLTNN